MKRTVLFLMLLASFSCAEMQQVMTQVMTQPNNQASLSNAQIGSGLKQALDIGVDKGISLLAERGGFFRNEATRILLPKELQQVEKTLRKIGLNSLADEGLKALNRAAENAVIEAKPIFKNAISNITFNDVSSILMGGQTAATSYLQNATTQQLVASFEPNIEKSIRQVGADQIWSNIISKYNLIAGKNINPNLSSYVTEQAVAGVFKMIAQKETDIRQNFSSRTTDLLQKVFALQDRR